MPLKTWVGWGGGGVDKVISQHVITKTSYFSFFGEGARCSSVVRAFAHGAMGSWIDPSWGGPIELFLVSASAPRLV